MPRTLEDAVTFVAPALFVLLWATGFIGAKLGLPYAEPLTFLTLRMVGAIMLLGIILLVARPQWPSTTGIVDSCVTGVFMHVFYLGGVYIAIRQGLSAGVSALIVGLQPLLTSTVANRLLGEAVMPRQWAGLLLGMLGIFLVVQDRVSTAAATPLAWAAAGVALVSITFGTVYQKRFGGGIDWRPGMFIQYVSAGVFFTLGSMVFETRVVEWTPDLIFALAWLVFVLSFGAIWLLYFLIRHAAATRVVALFYLTPPVTALMAWGLFNERLAPLALAGMAVCVVSVALVSWRPSAA